MTGKALNIPVITTGECHKRVMFLALQQFASVVHGYWQKQGFKTRSKQHTSRIKEINAAVPLQNAFMISNSKVLPM